MTKNKIFDFDFVTDVLEKSYITGQAPSVTLITNLKKNPYHILVSTIISLRTKDQVTLSVSNKLFAVADNIEALSGLSVECLSSLLYPCGFYKTKAANLKKIAGIIIDEYNGKVPDNIDDLLKLPGVGRKTANLVLILGYNRDSICVDTHVHRISNRLGWVNTKSPEETEFALKELLPVKYWRRLNDYMVSYGQVICKPISPFCTKCGLSEWCPKTEVGKHR